MIGMKKYYKWILVSIIFAILLAAINHMGTENPLSRGIVFILLFGLLSCGIKQVVSIILSKPKSNKRSDFLGDGGGHPSESD